MKARILLLVCASVLVIAANATAQGPPKFITLNPAKVGKPTAVPGATRRVAPAPLNSGALLLAVKSSTKSTASSTADYVNLSANQPFVNNKGMLSMVGGTLFTGSGGGSITLSSGSKSALGIFIIPSSAAQTYLVDVLAYVEAGESLRIYSPDGGFVTTTYDTAGDRHLLLMVTPQNADPQYIGIQPSKLFIFYSCKISVLK